MPDRFSFIVALFAFLLAGLALYRTFPPEAPEADAAPVAMPEEHSEGELAPYMAALQRHAEKLYHAGAAEHWELARFYGHELEEVAEEIVAGGFVEEGEPLAPLVARWLAPTVERAEAAAEAGDRAAFDAAYADLVAACNTCHEATAHGFVRITVPQSNAFTNQDFSP